jgi:hypothetical protein
LMTSDPENPSTSFVRWLHAQVKGDSAREMPYARIYQWGKHIHEIIGVDGRFDAEQIANELARQGANVDDLAALVSAEAAWRVDALVNSADAAGISLEPSADTEAEVSKALESPDATVMCGYRDHRGHGCTHPAVPGAGRCARHGGAITDPEVRRSFLLVAFAKVLDGSRVAVEALLDVAENGQSEMARVQAAKELLDRAGVQQDQHVHIHQPGEDASEDDLLDELRRRILVSRDRLRIQAIPSTTGEDEFEFNAEGPPQLLPGSDDDVIVDAEVMEDPDDV